MNDISQINSLTLSRDASLNTLMYLSQYYEGVDNGKSVKFIIDQANKVLNAEMDSYAKNHTPDEVQKKFGDDLRKVTVIQNAIKNDKGLGDLVIANQSNHMTDPKTGMPYEKDGLSACTFQDSLNDPSSVTVVYRGTGSKEWYDNGIGLSGETVGTEQQIQATEYFDYIVEKNGWSTSSPDIFITGHSKGGNKAQFVVMTSAYTDLIVNGYSLDGQCMSKEAIEYMKQKYGIDEFNRRREKLYSISADNDYVNILGVNNQDGRIIPNDHIFYLESNLSGVAWHYPDCYMNEDGSRTITAFTEQGEISKLLQGISEGIMDLPSPIRSVITNGAMGIAEILLGRNTTPVNGEMLSYASIIASVPLLLEMLPSGLIEYLGEEYNINVEWLSHAIAAFSIIYFTPINLLSYGIGTVIDTAIAVKEALIKIGQKCKELNTIIISFIDNGIKKINNWWDKNFNAGYKYATANPYIEINTSTMRTYASTLHSLSSRAKSLDRRMNSLYWQLGIDWSTIINLGKLLSAGIILDFAYRLDKCANYLETTATDFENAEKDIMSNC